MGSMTKIIAVALAVASVEVLAFQPNSAGLRPATCLQAQNNNSNSRRQLLAGAFGTAAALVTATAPASASYSAYTNREKDWQERVSNGGVEVSSARDLRAQLQEIAPMNTEGSKLFCPNGPSAAVSPLMENRCGDREATASVYGRTEDVLGNSIPGFSGGRYTANMGAESSGNVIAEIGGFPSYGSISATGKSR